MKTNLNVIKKKLMPLTFVLIFAIFNSVGTASAIPVFDGANLGYNIRQWVEATVSSAKQSSIMVSSITSSSANYSNTFKEYVLDPAAKILARQMLKQIETQSINWINSGFKGKPLFIQDPELFVKNIATDQLIFVKNDLLNQLQAGVNDVTNQLRLANKEVAKYVIGRIANEGGVAKANLVPNMGNTICTSMLAELNAIADQNSVGYRLQRDNYYRSCTVNAGGQLSNVAVKNCAYDFTCSGWAGILAVTGDLSRNTDAGRADVAYTQAQMKIAQEKALKDAQLLQGGGYLSQEVCVKEQFNPDGTKVCLKREIRNVGSSANTVADQVLRNTSQEFVAADEASEVLTNIASAFINKAINTGVAYVANASADLAREIDESVANLNRDINADINSEYSQRPDLSSPGSPNTGNVNVTNPGSTYVAPTSGTQYYLDTEPKDTMLALIKPTVDDVITKNRSERAFILKKIEAYQEVMDVLEKIASCYQSKSSITSMPYPENIPLSIRTRAAELNSRIVSLNAISTKAIAAENSLLTKFNSLVKITDSRIFEEVSDSVRTEGVNNPDLLTRSEYQTQNGLDSLGSTSDTSDPASQVVILENPDYGLYLRLQNEIKELTEDVVESRGSGDSAEMSVKLSPLNYCNSIRVIDNNINENVGNGA